jgi:hypothetical protein
MHDADLLFPIIRERDERNVAPAAAVMVFVACK